MAKQRLTDEEWLKKARLLDCRQQLEETKQSATAERSDLIAELHAVEDKRDQALERVKDLQERILDIDAHATPFGDIPDDPGFIGRYLVTAGALHRALGKVGHTAPACEAEAQVKALRGALEWALALLEDQMPGMWEPGDAESLERARAALARAGITHSPPEGDQ